MEIDSEDAQIVFARILSVCYVALLVASALQLILTVIRRNDLLSFRFGFISLAFLWSFLR